MDALETRVSGRLDELAAQFSTELTPLQRAELRRVAELRILAADARESTLNGGAAVSVADLVRLEDCATAALASLNLPPAKVKRGPDKMEIVLVRPDDTELSKQCDSLRQRVADLERQLREAEVDAGRARGEAEEARGGPASIRHAAPFPGLPWTWPWTTAGLIRRPGRGGDAWPSWTFPSLVIASAIPTRRSRSARLPPLRLRLWRSAP
jgi:hypothetical protein